MSGVKHMAELVEVQLTEQLLVVSMMLSDCATSEGRAVVKQLVQDIHMLGERLRAATTKAAQQMY